MEQPDTLGWRKVLKLGYTAGKNQVAFGSQHRWTIEGFQQKVCIIECQWSTSFSQFVNGYRIEYAKRVLRSQPDTKVTSLYLSAGFSSEQSFYRNFKSFTGMTPKDWIASQKD